MSLRIWLPLNGDLKNQGLYNLPEPSKSELSLRNDGKIGQCYNKYIIYHLSDDNLIGNEWSVCMWVRPESLGQYNNILFCKNIDTSTQCQIYFSIQSNQYINLGINGGINTSNQYLFEELKWYHLCATYNGEKWAIYVNGELFKSGNYISTKIDNLNNIGIGCRSSNTLGTVPTGQTVSSYNDFRLYDHALSLKQIKEISKGLVLHYPLDDRYVEPTVNLLPTNLQNFTETGTGAGYYSYVTSQQGSYTLSGFITCRPTDKEWTFPRITLRIKYTDGSYTAKQDYNIIVIDGKERYFSLTIQSDTSKTVSEINGWFLDHSSGTTGKDATIRNAQLEAKDHATPYTPTSRTENIIYDTSGYQNNGTVNGALICSDDTSRYNYSIYMDKNTVITHPCPIDSGINQQWTCAAWVKLDNTTQALQSLNDFNRHNNIIHTPSNCFPLLYLNDGTNDYYNYGNKAIVAGEWTHIAFVFKNSDATKLIYINGENCTNINGPNKTSIPYGIPDIITVGKNLAGYISDYRIYATALSEDDIKKLYKTAVSIDRDGNYYTNCYKEIDQQKVNIEKKKIVNSFRLEEKDYNFSIIKDVNIASFSNGADNIPVEDLKVTIEPVQEGSGDPSPDNVRPISGWTGAQVVRAGKNLFDKTKTVRGYIDDYNGELMDNSFPNVASDYIPVAPNQSYYINSEQTKGTWGAWYDKDKNYISGITWYIATTSDINKTKTAPNNAHYMRLTVVYASNNEPSGNPDTFSVNYPSTDHDYHPYAGDTYPITFPSEAGTVYGGELDVTNGVLTVDRAMVDLGSFDWISEETDYSGQFRVSQQQVRPLGASYSTVFCSVLKGTRPKGWRDFNYGEIGLSNSSTSQILRARSVTFDGANANFVKEFFTGQTLVYELAEPQTYQLTPQEVKTFLGTNNIWADTGKIQLLKYYNNSSNNIQISKNGIIYSNSFIEN